MLPQQTPYTPSTEVKPEMQTPPYTPPQAGPEYNEQFIETLARRLMPRLMPEVLYYVRTAQPMRAQSRPYGMSLALAIVTLALMIPLIAIVLGVLTTTAGGGIVPALIGISVIGLVMLIINLLFNYVLFNIKD
jgi:hypothetical protein